MRKQSYACFMILRLKSTITIWLRPDLYIQINFLKF